MRINKFNARKTRCLSKHVHDSLAEARHCNWLLAEQQAGRIGGYEVQKYFALRVNGIFICGHTVDFLVYLYHPGQMVKLEPDALIHQDIHDQEVHEVKGYATADWKIKRALFEALYPAIKYKVIKKETQWTKRRSRRDLPAHIKK